MSEETIVTTIERSEGFYSVAIGHGRTFFADVTKNGELVGRFTRDDAARFFDELPAFLRMAAPFLYEEEYTVDAIAAERLKPERTNG